MQQLKFFDCNARIGLDTVNSLIVNHENYFVYEKIKQAPTAKSLLEEMDFCGVGRAVTYHQTMFDVSPEYGNAFYLAEPENYSGRLTGTLTVLPSVSDKDYAVEKLFARMKQYGIFALRAFPAQNRYFLDGLTCGDLLSAMIECRIPLYLTPMDGWQGIFSVLKEFPKLTVIICNYGLWGSDRYFYPLVKNYENVYIDTSDFQVLSGISSFVRQFSAEKMLYGSNFPMNNMGGPMATLLSAEISDGDKELIAHKNIERLIAGVRL